MFFLKHILNIPLKKKIIPYLFNMHVSETNEKDIGIE